MDKYEGWRSLNLGDISSYNDSNFIYLVHAIDLPDSNLSQLHCLNVGKMVGFDNYSDNQNIDLNLKPERISEKKLISCSLITPSNGYQTYKPYGLILKCPIENIVCANKEDMRIDYLHPEEVIEKYKEIALPSLRIITSLSSSGHNEVLVQGTTEFGKVEVIGTFVNYDYDSMDDQMFAEKILKQSNKLATRLNIPLKPLPKKKIVIEDEDIEVETVDSLGILMISFNKNGKKYRLFRNKRDTELQSSTSRLMNPMSEEDFIVFMNEITKLDNEYLIKYKDLIASLPEIFKKQQLQELKRKADQEKYNMSGNDFTSFYEKTDKYKKISESLLKKYEGIDVPTDIDSLRTKK